MRDFYRILDPPLGEGAYGEARRCIWKDKMDLKSPLKEYRAVKILRKNYMEDKDIRSFQNEVDVMRRLNHPNIVKLHEFYEDH